MRGPLLPAQLRAAVLDGSRLYTSVRLVAQTGSTNADLLAAARRGAVAGAILIAEQQTAGRGRLDRHWYSRPVSSLTFSLLLRPAGIPPARRGWLPLLTGVAVAGAVREQGAADVSLKWPNDVLAARGDTGGRPPESAARGGGVGKLAGILAEQAGDAVVIGIGLNVSSTAAQLPYEGATSLLMAGAPDPDRQAVLAGVLRELERWYLRWAGGYEPGDAIGCGLLAEYLRWCATIGRDVRVELPGGAVHTGRADGVDEFGRLLVTTPDGMQQAVSAGDVVHVR